MKTFENVAQLNIASVYQASVMKKSFDNIFLYFCRKKTPGPHTESVFIAQLEQSIALEFERCDAARKLRLLVSELLFIVDQVNLKRFVIITQILEISFFMDVMFLFRDVLEICSQSI